LVINDARERTLTNSSEEAFVLHDLLESITMAGFVPTATLSSGGVLSSAAVQSTAAAAAQQTIATPIVTEESGPDAGDTNTSDLLQQAMNEVSFDPGSGVSYIEHSGEVVYVREDGKLVSLDGMIVSDDLAVMSVPQTTGVVVCGDQHGTVAMDVSRMFLKPENTGAVCDYLQSDQGLINETTSAPLTFSTAVENAYLNSENLPSQATCPIQIHNVCSLSNSQISEEEQNSAKTVLSDAARTDNAAPLGSSQNPIRIIQRGNKYTAMQHLTPDQLSQILQVIQEQQQVTPTKNPSSSSSAILYNPDAGSQVVYHVTTSSDSAEGKVSDKKTVVSTVSGAEHWHQRRTVRKRRKVDEKMTGSELSRQEKEEKKKHRPRTRSGRVSKPPPYMIKDYKHIHPVDYDEDYDDSDGGYSDFKNSGDEESVDGRRSKDDSLLDTCHPGKCA